MSTVAVPETVVAIKNVHPLERSTEKLLPAPGASEVPFNNNVFLIKCAKTHLYLYYYCYYYYYEENCTPVPPLPPMPILGRRRAVT